MSSGRERVEAYRTGPTTFSLTLARGRPDLYPESPVRLTGFKQEIDDIKWVIKEVTHHLREGGLTTELH